MWWCVPSNQARCPGVWQRVLASNWCMWQSMWQGCCHHSLQQDGIITQLNQWASLIRNSSTVTVYHTHHTPTILTTSVNITIYLEWSLDPVAHILQYNINVSVCNINCDDDSTMIGYGWGVELLGGTMILGRDGTTSMIGPVLCYLAPSTQYTHCKFTNI